MCTMCGCGQPDEAGNESHTHGHGSGHHHGQEHDHHHGRVHEVEADRARIIEVERDILSRNDELAAGNRAWFAEHGVFALNLVSSPGAGKTTLLVRSIEALKPRFPVAVIEGDQQTDFDAERIRDTGVPAVQVNTGKGCHLDAGMVGRAVAELAPADGGLLFIENVGNLICPAGFDLGEAHKVVILSVTEGEDKPLKYPGMFAAANLMVLNKTDLLPHAPFDAERCIDYARRVNPEIEVLRLSARTGEGLDSWFNWIEAAAAAARKAQPTGAGRGSTG